MTGANPDLCGEEWRGIDEAPREYDPARQRDFIDDAHRRIRELRAREVTIRCVDAAGRPLVGLPLRIEQQRHAFPFGDQVWALDARYRNGQQDGEWARAFRRRFEEIFSAVTNLCYWTERPRHDASKTEDRQGDWRIESFAATVDWTVAAGMRAKGHPLFWSIPKAVPDWVQRYDYETQLKFAEVRVRNLVARFKGKVTLWDAVNEPMWEPAFRNLARRQWPHIDPIPEIADSVGQVLAWCREEDPDATFIVNDYGMEGKAASGKFPKGNDGSIVTPASQRRRFIELFCELERRGVPADAIGLQSHTGWVTDHSEQWDYYDEFHHGAGLPIHISEFWAKTDELEKSGKYRASEILDLQAEYIANYLTTALAHPAVDGFFFWGFMGAAIRWHESGGHELLPAWERVIDLIRNRWWSREETATGEDGSARVRLFHGEHGVRAPLAGGGSQGHRIAIGRECGGEVTLRFLHRPG